MSETAKPLENEEFPVHAIVDQSLVGLYVIQDERFVYVNATFAGILGYTPEEMTGVRLQDIAAPHFREEVMARYYKRLAGDPPSMRFISVGVHRDGHIVKLEVHGGRMHYGGRPAVVGVAVDATERLQREEELHRSRAQLRQLAAYINRVREHQRARFARELHDVLGGILTSIKMDVTRIRRRVKTPELLEMTRDLLDLTQEAIRAVRDMSEELRPAILDHLGLRAAIERELLKFSERFRFKPRFEWIGEPLAATSEHSTAVYRILQEALTNVARHSGATEVSVRVTCDRNELQLEVIDNGRGIEQDACAVGSLGILNMRERARELRGRLELGPHPHGGTRLHLVVPFAPLPEPAP